MSRNALPIQGWEEQSLWGNDGPGGWFAQLSRNGYEPGPDDAPEISVGLLGGRLIEWVMDLQSAIAEATGASSEEVEAAMRWVSGPYPFEIQDYPEHVRYHVEEEPEPSLTVTPLTADDLRKLSGRLGIGVPRRQS